MLFKQDGKKKNSLGASNKKHSLSPSRLSLDLHTMPKTETGHFHKWLILAGLIFVLIILTVLFFL
ncbi:hypothetical protein JXK06_00515 [Patescibacteria group bacterium]|nr:hypothetical protein [Patescibacteria group bacterium]